jgi:hypothetical protein
VKPVFWQDTGWRVLTVLAFAAFVNFLVLGPASAHESRPAYLEVKETAPDRYGILWRTPVLSGNQLLVTLKLPEGIEDTEPKIVQELSDSRVERRWIDAGPGGLTGKQIEFVGLQFTITDVLARFEFLDGRELTLIARPSHPYVTVEGSQSSWQVALTYTVEGVRHIGFGFDHLLFVLALLLIVKGGWMLLKTVTAFTVAHSITLALATLGIFQPARPPIEVAIAMSILFLAPEILRQRRGETSFTLRHPWVVAFAFGLLHGLGFATMLNSTGLPPADLPLALLFFNVGVEIGQLAFVLVIVLLERVISRLRINWPLWLKLAPGYAVGIIGAFWTFQRAGLLLG